MEYEIQCNECGWIGHSSELVSKTADMNDNDFNYCPDCGSGDIEDLDEEEE